MLNYLFLLFVFFSNSTIWKLFDQASQLIYQPLPSSIQIEFKLENQDQPVLTNHDILGISLHKDSFSNEDVIGLYFNPEGAKKLADITREHIHEKLSVFINGELMMSPMIMEAITSGEVRITLGYNPSPEELKILNLFKEALQK